MIGKIDKSPQLDIFRVPLYQSVKQEHELVKLAGRIRWDIISEQLSIHYSPDKGRKAIPVRKMAGILILKKIFNVSDASILKRWLENPAFQYFCGEIYYQEKVLCNRSDLVSFRKRIGEKGMRIIFYPELLHQIEKIRSTLEKQIKNADSSYSIFHFFRRFFNPKPVVRSL